MKNSERQAAWLPPPPSPFLLDTATLLLPTSPLNSQLKPGLVDFWQVLHIYLFQNLWCLWRRREACNCIVNQIHTLDLNIMLWCAIKCAIKCTKYLFKVSCKVYHALNVMFTPQKGESDRSLIIEIIDSIVKFESTNDLSYCPLFWKYVNY